MAQKKLNKGGRPLKFQSVKELQRCIDAYFESCWQIERDNEGNETGRIQVRPYTITGLALFLGTTRRTLLDYEERERFSHTVKMAKVRCENFAEEQLFLGKNAAGPILALKNYGWTDRYEQDHRSSDLTMSPQTALITEGMNAREAMAAYMQMIKSSQKL